MRRVLADGFELDDAPARVEVGAVHGSLADESYRASGRGRVRWLLHTRGAHDLYRRFGFGAPGDRLMERQPVR